MRQIKTLIISDIRALGRFAFIISFFKEKRISSKVKKITIMKNRSSILLLLFSFLLIGCDNQGPTNRAEDTADYEAVQPDVQLKADAAFLKQYTELTLLSMAAAEMAADRAINPDVRAFAEELSVDHLDMYERVQHMADENRLPLPNNMGLKLSNELEELREIDPAAFDKLYLAHVIRYHEAIADDAEKLIANSEIEPVYDFARRIKAQQFVHLNRAKRLLEQLEA